MDSSRDAVLELLRKWSNEHSLVKLSTVGPGFCASYAAGCIADVSGNEFTFRGEDSQVVIDMGTHSKFRLEKLTPQSPPSPEVSKFVLESDDYAILCEGLNGCTVVIVKRK